MKSDTIIISIHPVFVEKILSGEKKYEFRKHFPAGVRYMLVYTTSPVKKITALIEIESVLKGSPSNIWRRTRKDAGVTKSFFDTYFKDKMNAYAIKIDRIIKLGKPLLTTDLKDMKSAPQSYVYLKEPINNVIELNNPKVTIR